MESLDCVLTGVGAVIRANTEMFKTWLNIQNADTLDNTFESFEHNLFS